MASATKSPLHSLKTAAAWALVGAAGAGILFGWAGVLFGWHPASGEFFRLGGAAVGIIGYITGRQFYR